eukprot:580817-Alexandrium_andersonii.AAC.1
MTAVATMTAEAVDVSSPATTTPQASSGPHGKRPVLSSLCLRPPRPQHSTNGGGRCSTPRAQPASPPTT